MIRLPQVGAESGGSLSLRPTRRKIQQMLKAGGPAGTSRSTAARSSGRPSAQELTPEGDLGDAALDARHPAWIRVPLPAQLRASAPIVATFHDLLVTLAFLAFFQYEMSAQRHRGDADHHRLFDERHDRHLRPRAREHPRSCGASRWNRASSTRVDQPDPRPDGHHRGHRAHERVSPSFSSAEKCCEGSRSRWSSASSPARTRAVFIAAAIVMLLARQRPRRQVDGATAERCRGRPQPTAPIQEPKARAS